MAAPWTTAAAAVTFAALAIATPAQATQHGLSENPPGARQQVASASSAGTQRYTNTKYCFAFSYRSPFSREKANWNAKSGSGAKSVFVFNLRGPLIAGEHREAFGVNVYRLNADITNALLPAVRQELKGVMRDLERQDATLTVGYLRRTRVYLIDWDAVIVDEYHFGAWRDAARSLLIRRSEPCAQTLLPATRNADLPNPTPCGRVVVCCPRHVVAELTNPSLKPLPN